MGENGTLTRENFLAFEASFFEFYLALTVHNHVLLPRPVF